MPPSRRVTARGPRYRRPGVYAEPGTVRPETSAAAYHWPCPCGCARNLRGLLREHCSICQHVHPKPPEEKV